MNSSAIKIQKNWKRILAQRYYIKLKAASIRMQSVCIFIIIYFILLFLYYLF